jgi:SAM-dependent methyltransferase
MFNKGVEIGTDQGEFAEVLVETNPNLKLACIDPWKAQAYEPNEQPESRENQEFFDKRFQETVSRLFSYRGRVNLIRTTSMDAVQDFENNSLDFVYIDGNHDFLNVTQDIHFWLKKVRPGGILSGHDFVRYPSRKFNHVQKVVNAYTQSYHLLPVFLTDSTDKGLRRDRFRSWFLVKP